MECLMCLELYQNAVDFIQINSSTWKELNIENVIEKHLWSMNMFKTESQWLCLPCWHKLHDFHKFYIRTKSIHIDYEYLIKGEFRKGYNKTNSIVSAENLLEPEIVLEQRKTIVKIEHDESQAGYDQDDYNNEEDNNLLIQMSKCLDTSMEKLNMDSVSNLSDPLTKRTKKLRKCKTKNIIRKHTALTTTTAEIQQVNEEEEEKCVIKSEPDDSNSHAKITPPSPLIISANEVATLCYYYQSKLSIDQYDQFIAEHFKLNCSICHENSFVSFSELQNHFQESHQKRGYVICCETMYSDLDLLVDHINCHLNPEYFKCEFCSTVLTLRKNFENHMRTHENPHSCDICDKTFMSKYLVNKHKLTHVSEEKTKCPVDGAREYKCQICLRVSSNEKALKEHIRRNHKRGYIHKCTICEKAFKRADHLKAHVTTHTGTDMHSCDICDKTFMSKYLVSRHKLTHVSEEEKKFPCTMCDKFFAAECLLSCHQKVVHLKTYAKLCDICGQSMPSIEAFKRHMKIHAGVVEPSVSCDICGRLVSSQQRLRIHKKTIHPVDGAREYMCQICLRVSSNEKALKEHIRRIHKTGYIHKCTICEKAFKRPDNLKAHMATHTDTDLYKCPWCPKTFNSNGNMHNHRKIIHPKEWEEARRKRYSGKLPPNFKPPSTTDNANNLSIALDC